MVGIKIEIQGMKNIALKMYLHNDFGPAVEHPNGSKEWWINGQRHRENGPAIDWEDGSKEWWINGQRHRENGPAIIRANGSALWFINGKRHRIDGPAFIWEKNLYEEWWLFDQVINEQEYKSWLSGNNIDINNLSDEDKQLIKMRYET